MGTFGWFLGYRNKLHWDFAAFCWTPGQICSCLLRIWASFHCYASFFKEQKQLQFGCVFFICFLCLSIEEVFSVGFLFLVGETGFGAVKHAIKLQRSFRRFPWWLQQLSCLHSSVAKASAKWGKSFFFGTAEQFCVTMLMAPIHGEVC